MLLGGTTAPTGLPMSKSSGNLQAGTVSSVHAAVLPSLTVPHPYECINVHAPPIASRTMDVYWLFLQIQLHVCKFAEYMMRLYLQLHVPQALQLLKAAISPPQLLLLPFSQLLYTLGAGVYAQFCRQ